MTETLSHPVLGEFVWNNQLSWWERSGLAIPMFGGATVEVLLSPESDDRASIAPDVNEAAVALLALDRRSLELIVPHLRQNYRDCTEFLAEEDFVEIPDGEDILAHLQPSSVAFERDRDGLVYVSFECNCDWEIEHGLQLVLQRGQRWVKVSNYDGHLTDGHAYAKELLDKWMSDPSATLPVRTRDEILATPMTARDKAVFGG